jgi:2-amino-4-hydroxy-6-hydroxymethyldihydropteridine diphosphokinase
MTVRAYIGIGSNLNDPVAQVREAIAELEMLPDTILVSSSSLYTGKPMGPADQPDYVNAVAGVDTLLSASDLLQAMHGIEDMQGRERDGDRWGPRILDLDLLLYGNSRIDTPDLTVPHPGMHERDFVIVPLAEIAGNLKIPGRGQLSTLIRTCQKHSLKKLATG